METTVSFLPLSSNREEGREDQGEGKETGREEQKASTTKQDDVDDDDGDGRSELLLLLEKKKAGSSSNACIASHCMLVPASAAQRASTAERSPCSRPRHSLSLSLRVSASAGAGI